MKLHREYVLSTDVCPVCGHNAVMRLFKCRCANWYGWYALRFYCKDEKCPVLEVGTLFYLNRESAERQMKKLRFKKGDNK